MNPRPVLYLAGPFGAPDPIHGIQRNILDASEIALEAWGKGWAVICPHKNTADFQFATGIPDETWTEGYLSILLRCDVVLMLPGWERSPGSVKERTNTEWSLPGKKTTEGGNPDGPSFTL
mgnify:FL=1